MADTNKSHQLLYVIGRLYEAALDDTLWSGLAPAVASLFDAPSASLHVRYPDSEAHLLDFTDNLMPSAAHLRAQGPHWRRNDPWVKRARERGLGEILVSEDLFTDKTFESSSFYQDWCRYLDIFYVMGAMFPLPNGQLGGFGVHRPYGEASFTEEQRHLASVFLTHYRRALDMRHHFRSAALQKEVSRQVTLSGQTSVLALSAQRHVLYACSKAEAVLRESDGLTIVAGKVVTTSSKRMAVFERRIAEAIFLADNPSAETERLFSLASQTDTFAIPRPRKMPLILAIRPLRPPSLTVMTPAVLVLIRDPEANGLNSADLKELFGLTTAESNTACRLAEGLSLEAIAERQGIGLSTVRSHIKCILSKTNTTRQAEAVALILRCAGHLRSSSD